MIVIYVNLSRGYTKDFTQRVLDACLTRSGNGKGGSMAYCSNCGAEIPGGVRFCPNCGTPIERSTGSKVTQPTHPADEERAFFKEEGELIIKQTKHAGAGRKAVSYLAGGPAGYILFGRDKTKKTRAKGSLVVTNKAIYCAGNEYAFDKIVGITKQGTIQKSIMITFEKSFSEPGAGGVGGITYEVELKTKEIDKLFNALEEARLSKVKF